MLNLKFILPAGKPKIPTITDIYPGAELYETELSEMLGVEVIGLEMKSLFLAEDSPKNPLRRKDNGK